MAARGESPPGIRIKGQTMGLGPACKLSARRDRHHLAPRFCASAAAVKVSSVLPE